MHRENPLRGVARVVLASFALAIAGTQGANAAGTDAGTVVSNSATVDYNVGATPQTPVNSAVLTFMVDDRVDITVAEVSGGYTTVATGGTNEVLVFTVTNTGNGLHDFLLTRADDPNDPFGGTDNFDAAAVGIFVDGNANGTYESGTDTATYIDELGNDGVATVFVVSNIGAQAAGNISAVSLKAQVAQGGVASTQGAAIPTDDAGIADVPGTVQIVFADGAGTDPTDLANDGEHSDTDAYIVQAATISVTKSSLVISDPVNGTTNPKAIPLAIVEYTVMVSHTSGLAPATNVTVTDDLTTEITNGTVVYDADGYVVGSGMQVTAPNLYGGAATPLTNGGPDDEGTFAGNVVTVNGITLQPGESATVRFRVQIQ